MLENMYKNEGGASRNKEYDANSASRLRLNPAHSGFRENRLHAECGLSSIGDWSTDILDYVIL